MRIARIARTATITTYVAELKRDDFVVGLFVILLYFVPPGAGGWSTEELLHPLRSFARVGLFGLGPLDRLLLQHETSADHQLAIPPNLRLDPVFAVKAQLGAPGHVALLH